MNEVATLSGSISTVSRVLSGDTAVKPEHVTRVLHAVELDEMQQMRWAVNRAALGPLSVRFQVEIGSNRAESGPTASFTPAGIEKFFEETLERVKDPDQPPPDNIQEVAARYAEAAPRYGIEFLG